ncbi:MAG: sigma-70 family RNA polymerase sigma factor [Labilithrix sp.]|nr:sigma-70 family RNA polymerase sigma factor [Labilithrix sp.]
MPSREEQEARIRDLVKGGAVDEAATAGIRAFGGEIFGLIYAIHRDEADADEVFSIWCERFWRGLPTFQFRSSFRTWAYTIARNASRDHLKMERRRERRQTPLDQFPASAVAEEVRTATRTYLRSAARDRFTELRSTLDADDQQLLILRVDRQLAWNELARVFLANDDEEPGDDAIEREAARLRKRFQLVKAKLYELGKREGLVSKAD